MEMDKNEVEQSCAGSERCSSPKEEINIGKIVEDYFQKSGFSVVEFAKRIHTTRENVYNIFKRKSMDCELLKKISETLNHDFFKYYKNIEPEVSITVEYKQLIKKNHFLLKRLLKMIDKEGLN